MPDFSTTVELEVDAYLPADYIVNEQQKLDLYKRIAGVETAEESDEMQEELLDRFGAVPKSAENLLRIALIKARAHRLYITELKGRPGEIRFCYRPDARVHGEKIPQLLEKHRRNLQFVHKGSPMFLYRYAKSDLVDRKAEELLELTEELTADMERFLL